MENEDNVDCVLIPRKLLEIIYTDYIMFDSEYMTDFDEESMKMKEGCYWKYSDNPSTHEILNQIKFYLEK